ncbi:GHKL domain-containing protein [Vagococcus silagei]|uniref:GHKL domain-containing protein n=1 Tax=Vagococcus silagei TaxID=2508885 RepID=A0A4S3B1D8_9ENTE|nr:GHKL domain-containing protein [Vagococcus silagei]THB60582.1 GHKL domain-containing protein [Vagococcus silagei]
MLLMLLFLIIIFNNIKNYQNLKQENEKKKIEIEYLIKYTDETQKNYQELRRFKHDYLNILLSLEYFIQQKDFSKLEEYYYSKIKKTGQQLTTESNEIKILENIESEEVKSIFMMKLLVARQKNITFSIEIPEKIANSTSVNIVILIRILGIILDNAIEAVENDKNGKIEIGIFLMTNATLFVIKNTLKEHIPPLHQLKQEGFSTKGPNRGLGLTNIDNLSQKEEYLTINTKISDSWFTQELFIQNEGY